MKLSAQIDLQCDIFIFFVTDPAQLDTSFTLKQVVLGTDLLTSNYQTYLDNLKQTTTDRTGKYE